MKIIVEQYEKGILFRDGRFVQVLDPGRFSKFDPFRRYRVVKIDTRIRTFVIQNQEIMTADKVTLRMNALVKHRIADPVAAVLAVDDVHAQLYGDAQLALRAELASLALDDLLAAKASVGPRVLQALAATARAYGVELLDLGLRDLILPGEMKEILNRVIEAKKRAEASVIERREEIAAIRSQANTAELYEKSPMLLRLRELEALERVLGAAGRTIVLGQPGDLLGSFLKK